MLALQTRSSDKKKSSIISFFILGLSLLMMPCAYRADIYTSTKPIFNADNDQLFLHGLSDGSAKSDKHGLGKDTTTDIYDLNNTYGYNVQRLLVFWQLLMPKPNVINKAYLHTIVARIKQYKQNNVKVILDMHQDNWGPACSWASSDINDGSHDGAPAWATINKPKKKESPNNWYLRYASPCVSSSFANFWNNKLVDGIPLQVYYTKALIAIVQTIQANPELSGTVLGYELFNEPNNFSAIIDQLLHDYRNKTFLGTSILSYVEFFAYDSTYWNGPLHNSHGWWNFLYEPVKLALGAVMRKECMVVPNSYLDNILYTIIESRHYEGRKFGSLDFVRKFENTLLTNFYQRIIQSIRGYDIQHYIFIEPMSLSVNNGERTYLGKLTDPSNRLVYIPHIYPRNQDTTGKFDPEDIKVVEKWIKNQVGYANKNKMGMMVGEWGAISQQAWKTSSEFMSQFIKIMKQRNISWIEWTDGPGSRGPREKDKSPFDPYAEILTEIRPLSVAGSLTDYNYSVKEHTITLTYDSTQSKDNLTIISIPLYKRYRFSDIKITSSDKVGTWSYQYNASGSKLFIYNNKQTTIHTVTIKWDQVR